jgi:hypothetical protein
MFPEAMQACQARARSAICDVLRDLKRTVTTDSAVRALLSVAMAEQARKPGEAVAAMVSARSSPHADHPALGAAFALALHAGPVLRKQAEVAGLPADPVPLHVRALQAYPYNPAYWTDLGDLIARSFKADGYLLYDVALSLPMPEAQRSNAVLNNRRRIAARLRDDFPAFFLSRPSGRGESGD